MGRKMDESESVDVRDVVISEFVKSEALVNLLIRKGIITREELLEEATEVQKSILTSMG